MIPSGPFYCYGNIIAVNLFIFYKMGRGLVVVVSVVCSNPVDLEIKIVPNTVWKKIETDRAW